MNKREPRRLTFQQIAERAGVSRTAVSNWAKRHEDFPKPVSEPSSRPVLFDAEAIEAWLAGSDRLSAAPAERSVAAAAADALTSMAATGASVIASAAVLLSVASAAREVAGSGAAARNVEEPKSSADVIELANSIIKGMAGAPDLLADGLRHTVLEPLAGDMTKLWGRMIALDPREFGELAEAVTKVVSANAGRAHGGLGHSTSMSSELVAELALAAKPDAGTVSDPVCGTGDTLLRVARGLGLADGVYGQDIDPEVADFARARLWLHGIRATIAVEDALDRDADADSDLVVAELPFGQRQAKTSAATPRRTFAHARGPFASEASFVLDICASLSPEGVGIVLVPTAMLGATSLRDWREWVVSQGSVSKIVELPRGVVDYTAASASLLVLHPTAAGRATTVDLVDLSELNARKSGVAGLAAATGLAGASLAEPAEPVTARAVSFAELGEDVILQPAFRAATSITADEARGDVQNTGAELDAALTELEDFMEDWLVSGTPAFLRTRADSVMTVAELIESGVLRVVRAQATRVARPAAEGALTVFPTGEDDVDANTNGGKQLRQVFAGPGFEPLEANDIVLPLGGPRPATVVQQVFVDLGMVALGSGARALRILDEDRLRSAYLRAALSSPLNRMSATTGGIMRRPFRSLTVAMLPLDVQKQVTDDLGQLDEALDMLRRARKAVSKRADAILTWLSVR